MGFTSPSVVLCPKPAVKWVLAAQHNSSICKLDLCFPVTHSSFSMRVPSLLSLSSISRHFSRGFCVFRSFRLCAFPTHLVKSSSVSQLQLARWLSPHVTRHRLARAIVSLCLVSSAFCFAALSPLAGISEPSLRAATSPAAGARCCSALAHHVSCCPGAVG